MKYDFTSIMDRHGKDAISVDGLGQGSAPKPPKEGFDVIPMWVADMNFPTVPTIPQAIIERAKHPAYGYFAPTDEYFDSIIRWQSRRNGVTGLSREHIGYENGVLGGVISTLTAFASPGDPVLVHSPTYIGFTGACSNNGLRIVHSPLKKDSGGVWRMDYADMDAKLKENNIHVAIFCNPHNPCGRVWEPEEITQAMEVYRANDCVVVSDEIWSDIMIGGHKHTPTQSVSDDARNRVAAMYAPSKTFNLAGLVGSYHIIYNKYLRDRVLAKDSKSHYNDMNVLSMHALIGAYQPEGYEWVDELCQTLTANVDYACDYIARHFDGVEASKPEGTYMLFLDCTKWCERHRTSLDDLEKRLWDVGVAVQDGRMFQHPCAIRVNLALPLSRVKEAFGRMDKYAFNA
ncbi:putative aminotransferase [Bifidobacterium actinocoloniiforme DSM 22766]|uniref:cysteine-S-conjugate beta-lyase n=1 Tax=Bifidobacterium actinocoloniiforme DSM 22766 TaxID=1437605 RepID=A0A086YZL8_9BIFI|nr:aminotransferase class I/II-fold pyridoxal phosphate-dependent enzyme [Bifidobacterium actinocoloniiforme]AKV55029.1 aspartate aminotransferase [Bifidobacterium actinocoloniiforme DSM 22766]KFI39718.1 putative aminotransferase [Bifidobacterium actinocoloniiforme DSM 22766]